MKKIIVSVFLFLTIIPLGSAIPVIPNVSVQPSSAWLGEDINILLNCFDNEAKPIKQVYANITNIEGTINILNLIFDDYNNGSYSKLIDKNYFLPERTGKYTTNIICINNENNKTLDSINFTVSKLTGNINFISPDPSYVGDFIEIGFEIKKDNMILGSDVSFNVSLNNQLKPLKIPAFFVNNVWILKIDSPTNADIYNLKVTAFYNRTNISVYETIEVRNKIEFEIVSIDKDWIKTNDNITVKIKALERGNIIELNKNNVNIKIGSANAEITSISRQDDLFNVKIIAPNIAPGRYQLESYLNHNGYYSCNKSINYIVPIKGTIDNNVELKFTQGSETKLTLKTDAYGYYSGNLPPDIYDIEVTFPSSKLYLYGAIVNTFDDPIKYKYSDSIDIPGIRNAGLFNYEVVLSYSDVDIELKYIEKNVLNEDNLRVFECSNWNSGKNTCNTDWIEVFGEIDEVRNKVKVKSVSLSAFVVGEIKGFSLDFSLDKEKYYLDDKIIINGIVKDEDRKTVSNASIDVYVKNTEISYKTTADENGIFSLEISSPKTEGKYDLVLKVRMYPYKEFNGEKYFEIIKSRSVYIDFPDTIKISRGSNFTQEFSFINNGQADLHDLKISLEDIPENYYNIVSDTIDLKAEERKTLYIDFFIPIYAEPEISSATLKISGGNISEEKVFGFNIFEKGKENETSIPATGLATGFVFPEINYLELIYITIFAIVCFSVAIILKKRKIGKRNRGSIITFLFDVKNFIKTEENQKNEPQNNISLYDKLIATEFPNFLKFSKKLTKLKGDE